MKSERISPFWVGGYRPFSAISVLLGAETWDMEYNIIHIIQIPQNIKFYFLRFLSIQIDVFEIGTLVDDIVIVHIPMANSASV